MMNVNIIQLHNFVSFFCCIITSIIIPMRCSILLFLFYQYVSNKDLNLCVQLKIVVL